MSHDFVGRTESLGASFFLIGPKVDGRYKLEVACPFCALIYVYYGPVMLLMNIQTISLITV